MNSWKEEGAPYAPFEFEENWKKAHFSYRVFVVSGFNRRENFGLMDELNAPVVGKSN
jgi:hypothetical protein